MDKAYCVSLKRVVSIDEALELFRGGVIPGANDFACLDPHCRADYICINLGKTSFKVPPYFRTSDNPNRKHVEGCEFVVKEKGPPQVVVGPLRKSRHAIDDDAEIVFENSRPFGYFTVPAPWPGGVVLGESKLRYIASGEAESKSKAVLQKCYSVERVLNAGWSPNKKIYLDGHSETIRSVFKAVDNYQPDVFRRFIYCGLARVSGFEDGCHVFKVGRSFSFGLDIVDVYVRLDQSALKVLMSTRSMYYRDLAQRLGGVLRNIQRYPKNPFFIYALGLPKLDTVAKAYYINVSNIDHFYMESFCRRQSLISPEYSDWERNVHYFVDEGSGF